MFSHSGKPTGIVITTAHYLNKTSWWIENCTKSCQFILSKIIKTVATSCQILRLECTKFDFGSTPDPAVGAYSAPPNHLAGLKGAYFYGEGRKGGAGRG